MNIQQFQYVLAVVDSKNFNEAAEKCFVTQSTLSTMINKFEREIGLKIFNRKTKPVTVTHEGETVVDRLRVIVNEIGMLDTEIQTLKGEMTGDLKIGVIPTIAPYLLPLILHKYAGMFPKVNLLVKEVTTTQIEKALKSRELDIGILALPISSPELREIPIYDEQFMVYDCTGETSREKITTEELDFSRLHLLEEGHCLRTQVLSICSLKDQQTNSSINFKFESGSMQSLIQITNSSRGMTILPELTCRNLPDSEKNKIVPFSDPVPMRNVGLIVNVFFPKTQLLDSLEGAIRESVKGLIERFDESYVVKPIS